MAEDARSSLWWLASSESHAMTRVVRREGRWWRRLLVKQIELFNGLFSSLLVWFGPDALSELWANCVKRSDKNSFVHSSINYCGAKITCKERMYLWWWTICKVQVLNNPRLPTLSILLYILSFKYKRVTTIFHPPDQRAWWVVTCWSRYCWVVNCLSHWEHEAAGRCLLRCLVRPAEERNFLSHLVQENLSVLRWTCWCLSRVQGLSNILPHLSHVSGPFSWGTCETWWALRRKWPSNTSNRLTTSCSVSWTFLLSSSTFDFVQ